MQFVARIGTADGRVVKEVHTATDERALRNDLEKRGVHVFELRRRGLGKGLSGIGELRRGGRRKKVDPRRFLAFNQELAALLRAGLPLLQSLELVVERMERGLFRTILEDVRERIRTGEDLSSAFAEHQDSFPRLYPSILKAGERSGELEQVVRRFVRYQKLVLDSRKRVVSALVYPAVLVATSAAMIAIMMTFVVPKFSAFFEGSGVQLPLITRILLGVGRFFQAHWLVILVVLVVGGLAFGRWRRTRAGQRVLDRAILGVPLLGEVFHRFSLAEFCRSLGTLLAGGMPLVPSLEIGVAAVSNAHIRERLEPTIQEVREGEAFHAALERSGVFTSLAVDMVEVGEATGALDEMLANVADFLDEQVETRMQRILTLIEPIMLVFMGIVIGVILVALYLPLFSALSQTQM